MHAPLDLATIDESVTVVTADGGAARALREHLVARALDSGDGAVPTPDVVPFGAFVARAWQQLRRLTGEGAPLLRPSVAVELWERVVDDAAGEHLLAPDVAARSAAEAHRLLADYCPDVGDASLRVTESSRAFAAWRATWREQVDQLGRFDRAQVPRVLCARAAALAPALRPRLVALHALPWPPAAEALFEDLEAAGVAVERRRVACAAPARLARVAADDVAQEIGAIARWCASAVAESTGARIAVAMPDPAATGVRLGDALSECLPPATGGRTAFEIDTGASLGAVEMVADALALLRAGSGRLALDDASRVAMSPYFDAADAPERAARTRLGAMLVARLEESGERVFALGRVAAEVSRVAKDLALPADASGPLLGWLSGRQRRLAEEAGTRASTREWAARFSAELGARQWPRGRGLDARERLALAAFDDLADEFAALAEVLPPLGRDAALARLAGLAASQAAPAEPGTASVTVLSPAAAIDQHWTHLWLAGMTEARWPAPVTPNPFLPSALARVHGMPGASAAATLEAVEATTRALLDASNHVTASYARLDGELPQAPSPLLWAWPDAGEAVAAGAPASLLDTCVQAEAPALESFADWRARVLPDGAEVRGGSGMLRDQATCPFLAFAARRLEAKPVVRRDSALDALTRGTLVHDILQSLWAELRTSAALHALDDDARSALAAKHADGVLAKLAQRAPSVATPAVLRLERERLVGLGMAWLAVDAARPPFEVVAAERELSADVGDLRLRLFADRIDRVPDGLLVLDYKTGSKASPSSWTGERMHEPQLPLYAITMGEREQAVAGIGFARVRWREHERRLVGWGSAEPFGEPRVKEGAEEEPIDFDAWLARWYARLTALAAEHKTGLAVAAPREAAACKECTARALCRIDDLVVPDDEPDDATGDEP